jgi:hypothetical protein
MQACIKTISLLLYIHLANETESGCRKASTQHCFLLVFIMLKMYNIFVNHISIGNGMDVGASNKHVSRRQR